jgi:endonuclease/exonuclease/phosphatase family metal-dependent hydrolase
VRVAAPRVVAPRLSSDVVATTFNALGSQHTRPGGDAYTFAPGRIRSEWTADLVRGLHSSFVGFQELQTDQYAQLRRALDDRYGFFPTSTRSPRLVWQTVAWDNAQWEYVDSRVIDIPFQGRTRPNPMVRLRNLATGTDVWVLNVHNVSKPIPSRQVQRNEAVRLELEQIAAERADGVPVVFLGDMNEREVVFCKVTGQTDLAAVTGGSNSGGRCTPPRSMHLDWIFASPELRVDDAGFIGTPLVNRITDHHVLSADLALQ